MTRPTRYDDMIFTHLDNLIAKTPPYSLSCPTFGDNKILDFVKGLIISTNVIEVINEYLCNDNHADWGQIMEKDGNFMSNESDIIVYKGSPGCKLIKNASMRFVLVDKEQTKLVIQVKSSIDSVRDSDKTYCRELRKYAPKVWYLAECCWAKNKARIGAIGKQLKKAGYGKFIYFYVRNEEAKKYHTNYSGFKNFIESIKQINKR